MGRPWDLEARDDGSSMVRASRANALDGILHVVEGAIGIRFETKLESGDGSAFADVRGDVLHARDTGDGIFHLLRHLRFEFGGAAPD